MNASTHKLVLANILKQLEDYGWNMNDLIRMANAMARSVGMPATIEHLRGLLEEDGRYYKRHRALSDLAEAMAS